MKLCNSLLYATAWICLLAPLASLASSDDEQLSQQEFTNEHNPQTKPVCTQPRNRPCVALVLGGGGARGGAHIGVLKMLEEQHIPVDMVVGTSIGAFVGGLYASGKSPVEIEFLFEQANWNEGYRDELNRSHIPNRRKRQLDEYPIHLDLGFDGREVKLPKGFLQGQGMKVLIDEMLGSHAKLSTFDELNVPFRAVAANIETGQQVVIADGDLATAIQISMSLPGIVRPIERDGQMLVDGGIANNLPVSVARALGADIIIAVNIGSPSRSASDLDSGFSILTQLTGFLVRKNVSYQISLLTDKDIYLQPEIEGVGLLGFDKIDVAIDAGYQAALASFNSSDSLQALAMSSSSTSAEPAVYSNSKLKIDQIVLSNNTRLADDYILNRMELEEGKSYSPEDLQKAVDRLYGQGTIARVTTSWERIDEETVFDIRADEKEWGPGYLDFKLQFEDDFEAFSRYEIGASYRLTNLSPYGAEWYTTAEFGTEKLFQTELYWPIYTSGFYWEVAALVDRNVIEFTEDGNSFGQLITTQAGASAGLGWSTTDKFDVLIGTTYYDGKIELPAILASTLLLNKVDFTQAGAFIDANYDTLDNASFPTRGLKVYARLSKNKEDALGQTNYSTLIDSEINGVVSLGRNSLRALARYQSALDDSDFSLLNSYTLGGFLNLSGNPLDSFIGQHVRFFSLVYTYELAENNFGALNLPLYLGMSAETGNAWEKKSEVDYGDMVNSGSLFLGWDSPLGSAYLAYGGSDTGKRSIYLFLGVLF